MKNEILVVCPFFFGYQHAIREELEKKYDTVYLFPDTVLPSLRLNAAIKQICLPLHRLLKTRYEQKILTILTKQDIKTALIIKGSELSEMILQKMAEKTESCIIHYQWDSIKMSPNALIIAKYATRNYTFDRNDYNCNPSFEYLPLFYHWCSDLKSNQTPPKKELVLIGSYMLERVEVLREIETLCMNYGISIYCHLYLAFFAYIKRLFHIKGVLFREIKLWSISKKKYSKILERCSIVLDVPSPQQTGLTMRTIEALSLGKKLITTNENIKYETFYDKGNILIWPEEEHEFTSFVNTPSSNKPAKGILSLKEWLEALGL